MADLTLQQVADQLPAGSFTETADDVTVSLKALTGNAAVQLADEATAEAVSKLLQGCASAQTAYNAGNPPANLTSYPNPTFGAPVSDGSGGFNATRTHSVSVRAPLNLDDITAQTAS